MSTLCRLFRTSGLLALALGATLSTGCKPSGGKSAGVLLDEANDAKDHEDWKRALTLVDSALADSKASAEEKAQAWQDKVICEGHVNGDAGAIAALKKMEESKVEMTSGHYARIAEGLTDADRLDAAVAAIAAGTERFKSDPSLRPKFEKLAGILAKKMDEKGDTEGQAKLKSLGYIGGNK